MHLAAGTRLGAYEIVAPLGAGGMGEVYRAHDFRVGRDVAIKVLPQRLARDDEARARLIREAKAVAAISHPNVLHLYELEQEGDLTYVVTELLEGMTLRTFLARGPMGWRRAAEIGAAIADGLAAAHAKRIVHRDLKPENIFITNDGRVKILDFGLARARPQPSAPDDDTQPTEKLDSDELGSDANVIGTVGAAALAAIATLAILGILRTQQTATDAPIRSLAVLPFTNDTADAANEYLSDGLTESLINNLSHIPDLAVVSRASVFRYKRSTASPQQAAGELKVQAVLTGRIYGPKDALIISTELIDGRDNRHLWGEQFHTRFEDLATAQAAISRKIAEQLRLELSDPARASVSKRHTESGEAYSLYLHGRYELNQRTGEAFERAIGYFRDAVARDPTYALAHAGLADCYILQSIYNEAPPARVLPLARQSAQRALDLDEELAEAHTSLAYFEMNFGSDLNGATREFQRAIELNPSYATAHQWYSRCLVEMGRYDDAIREIRRAETLDPLSLIIIAELGGVYADAGRLDEAVAECKRALALEPEFAFGHYVLAGAFLKQHRAAAAVDEAATAYRLGGDPRSLVRTGLAQVAANRPEDAKKTLAALEALSQKRFVSSYSLATLMIALGRVDEAFKRLGKAEAEIPPGQYHRLLRADPLLATIRADPRFPR